VADQYEKNRGIQRYQFASPRNCSLSIISFNGLARTDHVVRIMDMSVIGLGIETTEMLEPGLVWFKKQVVGHRVGIIEWTGERSGKNRAGIRFVTLSREEERIVREEMSGKQSLPLRQDREKALAAILKQFRKVTP